MNPKNIKAALKKKVSRIALAISSESFDKPRKDALYTERKERIPVLGIGVERACRYVVAAQ